MQTSHSSDSHMLLNDFVLFHTCFSVAVVGHSICDHFTMYVSEISLLFKEQHVSVLHPDVLGVVEQTELQDSSDSSS